MRTAGGGAGGGQGGHGRGGGATGREQGRFGLRPSLYLDRHTRAGARVHGHEGLLAGPWGAGIRYAMQGQGWYPELVTGFVGDGLEATGRSPDLWRAAMLTGIAEIVVRSDHDAFAREHLELLRELVQ